MDKFFVNPGSATGAFSTGWGGTIPEGGGGGQGGEEEGGEEVVPSFCLMDVQGISLTLYVYQLRKDANGENVAVEKVTYTKPVASS